jgi:hypothetical protein
MQRASAHNQTVESLTERILELVAERQALRATAGDLDALERNRLEIARLQQQLSYALIERHRPAA